MLSPEDKAELLRLRKENKQLRMEKEILKKDSSLLCERTEVKYGFIKDLVMIYPVRLLCRVIQVSHSLTSYTCTAA